MSVADKSELKLDKGCFAAVFLYTGVLNHIASSTQEARLAYYGAALARAAALLRKKLDRSFFYRRAVVETIRQGSLMRIADCLIIAFSKKKKAARIATMMDSSYGEDKQPQGGRTSAGGGAWGSRITKRPDR